MAKTEAQTRVELIDLQLQHSGWDVKDRTQVQELINTDIAGRDYQIRAIRSVLEGIEKKKRDFLLVMATGTGKNRTCIAMVDAPMRASHVEKVEAEGYDSSLSRYKEDVFEEIEYESPSVILDKLLRAEVGDTSDEDLAKVNSGIVRELFELRDMIK